jgi:hypothetical protein
MAQQANILFNFYMDTGVIHLKSVSRRDAGNAEGVFLCELCLSARYPYPISFSQNIYNEKIALLLLLYPIFILLHSPGKKLDAYSF